MSKKLPVFLCSDCITGRGLDTQWWGFVKPRAAVLSTSRVTGKHRRHACLLACVLPWVREWCINNTCQLSCAHTHFKRPSHLGAWGVYESCVSCHNAEQLTRLYCYLLWWGVRRNECVLLAANRASFKQKTMTKMNTVKLHNTVYLHDKKKGLKMTHILH